MAQEFFRSGVAGLDQAGYDAGLRTHMQKVFNYMGAGLAITGVLAWLVANVVPLQQLVFGTPLKWLVMLAPLGFMMVMNFKVQTISVSGLKGLFWAFCGTMGLSMGAIFMVFTQGSIARAFFITAMMFGATSLYGYTTKRSLVGFGAFLMMGVFGLLIASVVNMFMMSSGLQWATSILGVAIFTGLTAYDTQRIKQGYAESWGAEANDKMAVFGALSLYMNFINAFQFLLQLTGTVRRD